MNKKSHQRWLWYALDHESNEILAFVFGKRKDHVFKKLKALLAPMNILKFYTDDWGTYSRALDEGKHVVGKKKCPKN